MTFFQSLSAAGFAATAISYGPARMGFGLFVPEFRTAFSMSTATVGIVSSLGFLGFFVGLLIALSLLNRRGPEAPVLTGLGAATLGIAIVALAPNVVVLALGVALAASSAGFAWTPFNDAVHRKVWQVDRPAALSQISTGTSLGIAAAGAAALVMVITGLDWRLCWAGFAVASAAVTVINWAALRQVERSDDDGSGTAWRDLARAAAAPLYGTAFVFGVVSAIYISFAADHLSASGGVSGAPQSATPALVFILYGLAGLSGLLTGRARGAIGLTWLVRALMAAGAVSVAATAILAGQWGGLIVSAGLQGAYVMMTSAVLAFWSERLFPALPSSGFTAALLAMAAGSILGPAVFGALAGSVGTGTMFLVTAACPAAMAILLRRHHVREAPIGPAAGS